MADFAWATVHGFITLVLEGQIGEGESPRALKARGLATLAAMAETVVRAGGGGGLEHDPEEQVPSASP